MAIKNKWTGLAALLTALAMLVTLATILPHSAPLFAWLFPQLERPVYTQEPFAWLLWQHVLLVAVSSLFSVAVGSAMGVWVTRPSGKHFKPHTKNMWVE